MIKIVRAASGPLQSAFDAVSQAENLSTTTTTVEFGPHWVKVMVLEVSPGAEALDVLELFITAFRADGWGFNAHFDGPTTALESKVVGYTFAHPSTLTRTGDRYIPAHRPAALGLEIPLPSREVPLSTSIIARYAADASALVIDLLTQQHVKEADEAPIRPVPLWVRAELSGETPDAPTYTTGLELDDEDVDQ